MVTTHLIFFSFFEGASVGEAPPAPVVVPETRAVRGRRYRIIEDPDLIQAEIKQEEKALKKEKKQLRILEKRLPKVQGNLYRETEAKVEKLEAKVDERVQKLAELAEMLTIALELDDDDEEVLTLSI